MPCALISSCSTLQRFILQGVKFSRPDLDLQVLLYISVLLEYSGIGKKLTWVSWLTKLLWEIKNHNNVQKYKLSKMKQLGADVHSHFWNLVSHITPNCDSFVASIFFMASWKNLMNLRIWLMLLKLPCRLMWYIKANSYNKKLPYLGRACSVGLFVCLFLTSFSTQFMMLHWNALICFTAKCVTFSHLFSICIAVVLKGEKWSQSIFMNRILDKSAVS